jgi:hypothetical protein
MVGVPVILGFFWGVGVAAVHVYLLARLIRRKQRGASLPSAWRYHASGLTRMGLVIGMLLLAIISRQVHAGTCVLAYAIAFLGMMVWYGIHIYQVAHSSKREPEITLTD